MGGVTPDPEPPDGSPRLAGCLLLEFPGTPWAGANSDTCRELQIPDRETQPSSVRGQVSILLPSKGHSPSVQGPSRAPVTLTSQPAPSQCHRPWQVAQGSVTAEQRNAEQGSSCSGLRNTRDTRNGPADTQRGPGPEIPRVSKGEARPPGRAGKRKWGIWSQTRLSTRNSPEFLTLTQGLSPVLQDTEATASGEKTGCSRRTARVTPSNREATSGGTSRPLSANFPQHVPALPSSPGSCQHSVLIQKRGAVMELPLGLAVKAPRTRVFAGLWWRSPVLGDGLTPAQENREQ